MNRYINSYLNRLYVSRAGSSLVLDQISCVHDEILVMEEYTKAMNTIGGSHETIHLLVLYIKKPRRKNNYSRDIRV